MSPNKETPPAIVFLGVLWVVSVPLFYVSNNIEYYREKIGVFGGFILKILGAG